jgi:hypothetical protein
LNAAGGPLISPQLTPKRENCIESANQFGADNELPGTPLLAIALESTQRRKALIEAGAAFSQAHLVLLHI